MELLGFTDLSRRYGRAMTSSLRDQSTDGPHAQIPTLIALASRCASSSLPSDEFLASTLHALRVMVFPELGQADEAPKQIAARVIDGFRSMIGAVAKVTQSGEAERWLNAFLTQIPAVCELLSDDVRSAYEGDPAATGTIEVAACYPGIRALFVYRFAHVLVGIGVPILPRMMSEFAHRETGIDIHPAAQIGAAVFIDHGTGVVIGETAVIGDRCRIYQGVTLGAKSFDREPDGSMRRGYKRHPTLESDVVVYAGATILGGETVIGRGSVVSGGVFLTQSVPAGHIVAGPALQLRVRSMGGGL